MHNLPKHLYQTLLLTHAAQSKLCKIIHSLNIGTNIRKVNFDVIVERDICLLFLFPTYRTRSSIFGISSFDMFLVQKNAAFFVNICSESCVIQNRNSAAQNKSQATFRGLINVHMSKFLSPFSVCSRKFEHISEHRVSRFP